MSLRREPSRTAKELKTITKPRKKEEKHKIKFDGLVKSHNPGHCEERSDVAI
jgi:hypothetical protein